MVSLPVIESFSLKVIVSLRGNLIPRVTPICRSKWWCSLFLFRPEILFWVKSVPKNKDSQFKLKFGTQNNLNMQNSMKIFTLSVLDRKYLFLVKIPQKSENFLFKLRFCS